MTLARAAKIAGLHVIAVERDVEFRSRLNRLSHISKEDLLPYITVINDDTLKAAKVVEDSYKKNVAFLHIDADHTYPKARDEFIAFSPMVIEGGVVCFHDAFPSSVYDTQVSECLDELDDRGLLMEWEELETQEPTIWEYKPRREELLANSWTTRAFVRRTQGEEDERMDLCSD